MTEVANSGPRMTREREEQGTRIVFAGDLTLATTPQLWAELARLQRDPPELPVIIDMAAVGRCDTAGAALVRAVTAAFCPTPESIRIVDADEAVLALLRLAGDPCAAPPDAPSHAVSYGVIDTAGGFALRVAGNVRETLEYIGGLVAAMCGVVLRPRRVRWSEVGHYMAQSGADGLGIVALISLLMGVIVGFQSVSYLDQYGLTAYLPVAVALGIVRQLGPLMTAVIVAGRSGSGFAAEIGTMKVNEEVDALDTMGLDHTRFLVLPKVLALFLVMPVLVLFADACGVFGGLLMGVSLADFTFTGYLDATADALKPWDLVQGLIMGQGYALVIAAIGCLRGLQTRRDARGVGLTATSAVVSSIFLIIVVDAVFSALFYTVNPESLAELFDFWFGA